MKKKELAMSYQSALDLFFGGINGGLKCSKCGYQAISLKNCWKHLRKDHGERIKAYAKT